MPDVIGDSFFVVYRTRIISFVYAITFLFFGVYSYPVIQKYVPTLKMYENLLPRLFLSSLPLVVIGFLLGKRSLSPKFRVNIWIISYPLLIHIDSINMVNTLKLKSSNMIKDFPDVASVHVFFYENKSAILKVS